MHVCMHSLTKHTHTYTLPGADFSSSCSFLLGTLKPIRVSLSLPPNPHFIFFSFSPLLLHFMCFCFPSSFCLCVWFPFFFPQSMFRVSYQIFHHVTVNKVKSSTLFFLHLFFFFLPTPVASQRLVLPPVSGMQPCCNTKCFSVLNLQVSGVFLNVNLFW